MPVVSDFGCLACGAPADPQRFYCAACLDAGRLMRDVRQRERVVVQMTCAACGERSPAYADSDAAACLHCHRIVAVTA